MIVLVKSAPDTTDGMRGIALAREDGADLILLQNGVFFGQKDRLPDFQGKVYVLDDDKKLRGLKDSEMDARARTVDYDKLIDIIAESVNVIGMF